MASTNLKRSDFHEVQTRELVTYIVWHSIRQNNLRVERPALDITPWERVCAPLVRILVSPLDIPSFWLANSVLRVHPPLTPAYPQV